MVTVVRLCQFEEQQVQGVWWFDGVGRVSDAVEAQRVELEAALAAQAAQHEEEVRRLEQQREQEVQDVRDAAARDREEELSRREYRSVLGVCRSCVTACCHCTLLRVATILCCNWSLPVFFSVHEKHNNELHTLKAFNERNVSTLN